MDKNISVWRGFNEPPTKYHLWVNEENDILLHDGIEWKTIVDDNNYEDLKQHLAHFPKMGVIDNIPIINTELLENEFSIYRLTQDVEVTSEYEKFDKTESFIAKKGDLYIQCKIPTPNEFIPKAVSPTVTVQNAINENRPIVLKLSSKDADVELDIVEGVLKTVRRQLTPTWIISGIPSNAYIKHIKTNQYLSWNGSNYILSTQSDTKFEFNLLGNGYEISRVGSSKALNPFQYTKPGVEIKEYNKGDSKNELVIIDPTLYELPIISSETVKTDFVKGEGFPYSLNFTANNSYYINSNDGIKVSDTPMKYFLCGTYEKLALVTSNNKVLIINNGNTIGISNSSKRDFCLIPHGHTSNKSFAICAVSNPDKAVNANAGIILGHNIVIYDTWDSNNGITFVPYASLVHKHIPLSDATSSYSGLMSKEDKVKLDGIAVGANNYTLPTATKTALGGVKIGNNLSVTSDGTLSAIDTKYNNASTSEAGLMSKEDKAKLDGIANNANNYSLPVAAPGQRGGIKIGYSQNANNRAVQLALEKAYVNIPDVTTEQSGLMIASDKEKLDNSSAYKHVFTGLSALTSSGDGWYHIIDLGDTEAAIVQISTGGHSDVQLAISSGWGGDDSFSLNILNSLLRSNPNYAYVKAIRIRKQKNGDSGYLRLEAKLNRTGYTDAKYRTTVVSVLTNANHNPIVISDVTDEKHLLQLVTTTSETLLQENELVDQAMIVKNIVADNLSTVATSGNYNDLKNKPSIASTTSNGLMSASDKQKIDSELDIYKITEPADFDFNSYTEQGVYNFHCYSDAINSPVNSSGEIKGRLTILSTSQGVITQVVNLNNSEGGEGNVYIRSYQNGTWKPWAKLQTNVEVGLVTLTALDNDPFLDNGIFSGVCGDTGETFVLICINNYAVAPYNKSIAQLKYSLFIGSQDGLTPGEVKIEKRSRNTTGFWTDWENIGGNTYLNPNDYLEPHYLSKLGFGTFEFSGTLIHDDVPDSIWRYIFEDLNIQNSQFNMKIVIDSTSRATATIMGCGKYDIVTFNPSNNKDVVSILNGSIINALNTEV